MDPSYEASILLEKNGRTENKKNRTTIKSHKPSTKDPLPRHNRLPLQEDSRNRSECGADVRHLRQYLFLYRVCPPPPLHLPQEESEARRGSRYLADSARRSH